MRTLLILLFLCKYTVAQELPARWDDLTASDFPKALEKSSQTCILPIGILEKHGPHVPIGSDLIHVREWAIRAVKKEYAVVFPDYFYGQINEARQQPGTFSLPSKLIWDLMEATIEEIARNGFKKIVIINGHGGNPEFIRFFMQSQLDKRRDYAVFFFEPARDDTFNAKIAQMRKSDPANDQHAGEKETSLLSYYRPDLVQMEKAAQESSVNQNRLPLPAYTAIGWYAKFPNHYAGEGSKGNPELGKVYADFEIESLAKALKQIKADTKTLQLQKEFYDRVDNLNK
jgi:creatinine amidohydrolase